MSNRHDSSSQMAQLLGALCDRHLAPQENQELNRLLEADPAARQAYIERLNAEAALYRLLWTQPAESLGDLAKREQQQLARHSKGQKFTRPGRPVMSQESARWRWVPRAVGITLSIAAAIVLPVLLGMYFFNVLPATHWSLFNSSTQATLADAVNAQWDMPGGLDVGERLPRGPLVLKAGFTRIRLDNGVNLVVQGPAHFSVDSESLVHLDQGKLTADVPHIVSGFAVQMPHAKVTDLGTTFGVTAFANGEGTVQVLKGAVQAKLFDEDGKEKDVAVLREDHAAAFSPMAATLSSISATPDAYVTDIHNIPAAQEPREEMTLSLHNTGEDLKEGDSDPAWRITARSDDPAWTPKSAVVTSIAPFANDWARSQWVSTAIDAPKLPNFLRLTFTTNIDLAGFDPASAKLHLRIWVDDNLGELRLNGKPMGPEFKSRTGFKRSDFITPHEFTVDHGFVAGINRLEFVAVNDLPDVDEPSPMELRVEMDGTAAQLNASSGGTK